MSEAVTEPKSLPSSPTRAEEVSATCSIRPAGSCAAERRSFSADSSRSRSFSMRFLLPAVASTAKPRGRRKLRAYPGETFTISPGPPRLSMACRRMTSMGGELLSLCSRAGRARAAPPVEPGVAEAEPESDAGEDRKYEDRENHEGERPQPARIEEPGQHGEPPEHVERAEEHH